MGISYNKKIENLCKNRILGFDVPPWRTLPILQESPLWSLIHKSPLSCPPLFDLLLPGLCSLNHKSLLSCPQASAFLSISFFSLVRKSLLSCPQVSTLMLPSLCSFDQKSQLSCSQASVFLSISVCSLVRMCPLTFTKVAALLSKTLRSFVQNSSLYFLQVSAQHTTVLIQLLFTQPPITILNITAKLLIQQFCNFHIISLWPQSKKRTTLLFFIVTIFMVLSSLIFHLGQLV